MRVRTFSPAQTTGASYLPGYTGRYYGAGAFPQGMIDLGGAPRVQQQVASAPPQVAAMPQQPLTPLGQTRPLLAYGLPAAAGLAVGGMLLNQGEDPGTATLGGTAAALGARGGLGAARLAGRYATPIAELAQSAITPVGKAVAGAAKKLPEDSKRGAALQKGAKGLRDLYSAAGQISPGMISKIAAGGAVPLTAGLAGLGGVAAGAIPSAMGVPGFQAQMPINPEGYGSSNTQSIYPTTLQLG